MKKIHLAITLLLPAIILSAQSVHQKMVSSDRAIDDRFGNAIAISGDYALVAASEEDEDASGGNTLRSAGAVYILKKNASGEWQELKKIVHSDRWLGDAFGYSVAISGNLAVVGALRKSETGLQSPGAVYIFEKDHGGTDNWGEAVKLVASDRAAEDSFGVSVAISGGYIIVGAYFEDEDALEMNTASAAGSAYIFQKDHGGTNNWGQVKKIVASDRDAADQFGVSVGISEDFVVVGAHKDEHDENGANGISFAGSAYIFQKDNGGINNWGQVKKIVPSDRRTGGLFGNAVSISDDQILVGTESGDAAFIFHKDEGGINNWGEKQKLTSSDNTTNRFGVSVAINGNHVLVGAPNEGYDKIGRNEERGAGAAYLFVNDGNTWSEIQKIITEDRDAFDRFGQAAAITSSGDFILAAPDEDEDINGLATKFGAGAVYFFTPKSSQSINFEELPAKNANDLPFELIVNSSSGLPIEFFTFEVNQGEGTANVPGTISGTTFTIEQPGIVDIVAFQPGNEDYWSVSQTQRLFVSKVDQTISFTDDLSGLTYGDGIFSLPVSASSGLEVDYDDSGPISIDGNMLEIIGAGSASITATQQGDEIYSEADPVTINFAIAKATITATADDVTIVFGETLPDEEQYPITYTGFVNRDEETDLSSLPEPFFDDTPQDAGTYDITLNGGMDDDYEFNLIGGTLTIDKADQEITFSPIADADISQSTTRTLSASSDIGLAIDYVLELGDGSITGNVLTINSTGFFMIKAIQAGNNNYNPAEAAISFIITSTMKDDQTISFTDDLDNLTYGDEAITLTATTSSTLDVIYSSTGPVQINGNAMTILGGGAASVTAIQGGDGDFNPADPIAINFTVDKAVVTATADDVAIEFGEALPDVFPITYSGFLEGDDETNLDFLPKAFVEDQDDIEDVGTYDIEINEVDDNNYGFILVEGTLTIVKADQMITFASIGNTDISQFNTRTLSASSDSGLDIDFELELGDGSISDNVLTINNPGLFRIKATQEGNNNYNAAEISQEITFVVKEGQTITFNPLDPKTFGEGAFDLIATVSSGLTVRYISSNLEVAAVSGSTVTIVGVGTTTITASQEGNSNYNTAQNVIQDLTVNKADQIITFDALAAKTFGDGDFNLSASGGESGIDIDYFSSDTDIAIISGSTVTIVGVGTTTITASQAGNAKYNAATDIMQNLTVNKASQTIKFETLQTRNYGDPAFDLIASGGASGSAVTFKSSDETVAMISGSTVTIVGAGTTTITGSQGGEAGYNAATDVARELAVNKANLTAKANNQSRVYNTDNPTLTLSYGGFIGSDSETGLGAVPSVSTIADLTSDVGTYSILPTGGADENYNFIYLNGTLTITKAIAAVEFDNLDQEVNGTPRSPVVTTSPEALNYDITFDGTSEIPSVVGTYEVVVTIMESNYQGTANTTMRLTDPKVILSIDTWGDVQVYPNPVSERLTVMAKGETVVELIDLRGLTRFKDEIASGEIEMQVRDFPRGVYLLRLTNPKTKESQQRRVILLD